MYPKDKLSIKTEILKKIFGTIDIYSLGFDNR